jgi:hypothetical protein
MLKVFDYIDTNNEKHQLNIEKEIKCVLSSA